MVIVVYFCPPLPGNVIQQSTIIVLTVPQNGVFTKSNNKSCTVMPLGYLKLNLKLHICMLCVDNEHQCSYCWKCLCTTAVRFMNEAALCHQSSANTTSIMDLLADVCTFRVYVTQILCCVCMCLVNAFLSVQPDENSCRFLRSCRCFVV